MVRRSIPLVLMFSALVWTPGCDDEDGTAVEVNDPGTFTTSVPDKENATVEGLDSDDFQQLCQDISESTRELVLVNEEAICHYATIVSIQQVLAFAPLSGDDLAMACDEALSACQQQFDVSTSGFDTSCPFTDANRASCTATVAELETCFDDQKQLILDSLEQTASLSCTSLSSDSSAPAELFQGQPASCESLAAKCPGLFGGDDTISPQPPGGN